MNNIRPIWTPQDSIDTAQGHYAAYAEKMDRLRAETEKRYPAMAPADFDPYYANERWDEDDY